MSTRENQLLITALLKAAEQHLEDAMYRFFPLLYGEETVQVLNGLDAADREAARVLHASIKLDLRNYTDGLDVNELKRVGIYVHFPKQKEATCLGVFSAFIDDGPEGTKLKSKLQVYAKPPQPYFGDSHAACSAFRQSVSEGRRTRERNAEQFPPAHSNN